MNRVEREALAAELERLITAERHALNTIVNQDHGPYNRAATDKVLWLRHNAENLLAALRGGE